MLLPAIDEVALIFVVAKAKVLQRCQPQARHEVSGSPIRRGLQRVDGFLPSGLRHYSGIQLLQLHAPGG